MNVSAGDHQIVEFSSAHWAHGVQGETLIVAAACAIFPTLLCYFAFLTVGYEDPHARHRISHGSATIAQ